MFHQTMLNSTSEHLERERDLLAGDTDSGTKLSLLKLWKLAVRPGAVVPSKFTEVVTNTRL